MVDPADGCGAEDSTDGCGARGLSTAGEVSAGAEVAAGAAGVACAGRGPGVAGRGPGRTGLPVGAPPVEPVFDRVAGAPEA